MKVFLAKRLCVYINNRLVFRDRDATDAKIRYINFIY